MDETASVIEQFRELGEQVCVRLRQEIGKLGFPPDRIDRYPRFDTARYQTIKDPYSGHEDIAGYWQNEKGQKIGMIQFHTQGTFYAEYDIVRPHPQDPRWFVESVVAWGKKALIKTEAKLLPALE